MDAVPGSAWEARFRASGLRLTAPRQAILAALLEQDGAGDAVILLTAAQRHYPATRIGTVYRFLRELERHRLVQALAWPHGRTHWQPCAMPAADAQAGEDIQPMIARLKAFLSDLERLGMAEAQPPAEAMASDDCAPTLQLLQRVAGRLGYRLTPIHS
ncbi:hypothetical protein ASG87_03190 [Frateuria sp. Soil773]|uniref:transcriptional repressor n=1 Tax=Frateuria sp. Soil773 TaxID=1736407 RepID=UPI000700C84B|nr:transcriptional repressor [Frateuria sp. Soil773]KRE89359.1 hypothetical protein ASG87_03190 [Frateuria sp. Soil773]